MCVFCHCPDFKISQGIIPWIPWTTDMDHGASGLWARSLGARGSGLWTMYHGHHAPWAPWAIGHGPAMDHGPWIMHQVSGLGGAQHILEYNVII